MIPKLDRASSSGSSTVPKGSMWARGFSVRRPARRAVSSPRRSATQPWATSWRMTDGTRMARNRATLPQSTPSTSAGYGTGSGVLDAPAGGGHRLQPGLGDRLAALLAGAVRAGVDLGQGVLDLSEESTEVL